MAPRKHIIISGTGRSGTTFLVELLTHLGLDTGFAVDELEWRKNNGARAGLENDIRQDDCPYVVKNPAFCEYAEEILRNKDINVEQVIVPIRDLNAAADSRRFVTETQRNTLSRYKQLRQKIKKREFPGGLWRTGSDKNGSQEKVLLKLVYDLMLAISDSPVEVTFIRYPRIVKDDLYLYEKLRPILGSIPYESFATKFNQVARTELVHCFNEKDS